MEEIDLKELYDFLKNKKLWLIIIIVAVLILGCIYSFQIKTPLYQSSATIILANSDNTNSVELTQNEVALNQKLVSTYSEVVKSRKILKSVIKEMNLDYTYEELARQVSVQSVENTEIIKVTVTNKDAVRAQQITDTIARTFKEEITQIYKVKNVNILDKANYSTKPSNINYLKEIIIYILAGCILGFGILFIIFYFDNTVKTAEQIEARLNLPILGKVPKYTEIKEKKAKYKRGK